MTVNEILVQDFEPTEVWQYFARLSNIPRLSENEKAIREWLKKFAAARKLQFQEDAYGNLVIYKPAQNSKSTKKICLQAHMDMVPATDSAVEHDFSKDPIEFVVDGDWLKARGTTLGADNGIGIAPILAILDNLEISHPPIQALFTVEEETGLGGVNNLNTDMIQPDYVVNIDNHNPNEFEAAICVGSAGGRSLEVEMDFASVNAQDKTDFWSITIIGLPGGHSGVDIHKNIPNAAQVLSRFLLEFCAMHPQSLSSMWGGEADNAIPGEAGAMILGKPEAKEKALLKELILKYEQNYQPDFPGFKIEFHQTNQATKGLPVISVGDSQKILHLINTIPSGIISMSQTVPGLVQTSNNLGILQLGYFAEKQALLRLKLMSRSDDDGELYEVTNRLISFFCLATGSILSSRIEPENEQILELTGTKIHLQQKVQGWKANPDNLLVQEFAHIYNSQTGKPVIVEAVHAGLECGKLLSYYPEAVAISVGPELHDLHTTRERLRISSVKEFYQVLVELISKL